MIPALALAVLGALTLAGLLRCCLPGEILHRWAALTYEYAQLYRPLWIPEKWLSCVFCGTFWLVGIPLAGAAAVWLGWWALAVPLPLALLTEHLTARFFR